MPSQPGIGRYEVVSVLGQGAMGTVYKAVDPRVGRAVALRTINLDRSKDARAEFEACVGCETSAGRLRHANIASLYDVGETDDVAYLAMEYVEGESLRKMLDSGVALPIDRIAGIVARVADALNYAHANHVVHRGIKPSNIMITPDGGIKIMDFDIAQIPAGSHTIPGTPGSPNYMAPEQVAGGNTDGRTDIFALGVVLYEMLTGVTPFGGDNLSTITDKVLKEEPVPPSTLNARVPPVFDLIISRALAKRPKDRYQTALAFARDLRNPDDLPSRKTWPAAGAKPALAVASPLPAGQQDTTGAIPLAADAKPAQAVASPMPAGQQDATGVIPLSADRAETKEKAVSLLGKAQVCKPLLLALPILIIAAFVAYTQGHQPRHKERAAALATPTPAAPTAPAMPRVLAAPTASATPAVPATPAAPETPMASAKPTASAAPKVGVPESGRMPPVAVMPAKATMALAISPWGEVHVDGNRVGVTPPLAALQLVPGRHEVEIRNQGFAPYRETVNLEPGKPLKIRHKFR
jgi:predicted Ser/Thr protein kinase